MSLKTTLLGCFVALDVAAVGKLFVDVRAAPPTPDVAKVEAARQRHQVASPARAAGPSEDPWASATTGRDAPPRDEPELKTRPTVGSPVVDRVEEQLAAQDAGAVLPTRPALSPRAAVVPSLDGDPRLELSGAKDEANRLYDKQDYEGALAAAKSVLAKDPGDIRMLRVVVSAACQMGDNDQAQVHWRLLPPHDRSQMARRCQRFGITFNE
jgi:hypothetical protein